jgi:hypothetical protein
MVFQHSASKFREGAVAFQEGQGRDCRNIRIIDTVIVNNGQLGLHNYCSNTVMRRNQVNDNGFGGIGGATVTAWLLEDNQTNRNGWRSWAGGYKGWATAGLKVFDVANFTARRHEAIGNFAEGFWIDTNNRTVRLEDSTITNNLQNGVFLEASSGPFVVRNNLVCGNALADVMLSAVAKVRLENNRILSTAAVNSELPELSSALFFSELRRKEAAYGQFPMRDISFVGNTIVATQKRTLTNSWIYYRPDEPADDEQQLDYEALVKTLGSSSNIWYSPLLKPFGWIDLRKGYGEFWSFNGWRTLTKQDLDSSFSNPGLSCPK